MNRLIIVGNGFDLAHGLPTSYRDFIDDYWQNIKSTEHSDDFVYFDCINQVVTFENCKGFGDLAQMIISYDELIKKDKAEVFREYGNNYLTGEYPREHILNYKNEFFKIINNKNSENWVDVENEYYLQLKRIVKSKPSVLNFSEEVWKKEQKKQVKKLNEEFDQVKLLLENYLEKVVDTFDFKADDDCFVNLCNLFYPDILLKSKRIAWKLGFTKKDQEYIDELIDKENNIIDVSIQFLCFNYTPTLDKYVDELKNTNVQTQVNYIHGELDNTNKINFGFGDEMDDDYKLIENIDDNEYLKNFKSFQYLHNSNYKTLLDFIDSEKFEVYIMGHSCGLSDRTLLNAVFEHDNYRLIKVFYHEKDGNDNFTELT